MIFTRRLRRWNGETSWIFSAGEREGEKDGGGEEDELIDVRKVLAFTKDQFEDETSELKKIHEDGLDFYGHCQ